MSRNTAVLIISAIIILFHYPLKAAETGWRLSMNKNGVSVYTKPAEDSVFDEFKGTIKKLRYSEIKKRIKGITSEIISDTTLSSRLKELEGINILNKEHFAEI